jgi:hypothetical protein
VHYWTVNDAALATRLLDVGADALMTDDPRLLVPAVHAWRKSVITAASSTSPRAAPRA